ncbi:energy-coupling factor transporter ATP-binding protein EcfA2 [Oxalobacteraceae bacterium GrIS 1.11]
MLTIPKISELANESDVEQKLVYPLLVAPKPFGFGISPSSIHTKANIKRFKIGKGASEKLYYPDYLLVFGGLPLVVIEAKTPGENLNEAFREARLYATELNASFITGINPVKFILATDGRKTLAGPVDQESPIHNLNLSDLLPTSEKMARLQDAMASDVLSKIAAALQQTIKPKQGRRPRSLLGGGAVQNEEIRQNSFGATISTDFSHIFNPSTPDDRIFLAKNGYIHSKRRERYIEPIDRVLRAARPHNSSQAQKIEDSGTPTEILEKFKNPKPLERKVLLLIGSVGSGKSTFVDYLQEVAIPREIMKSTLWCRLNMNSAPVTSLEIYDWLRNQIVFSCRSAYPEKNFDDLDVIKSVFSPEINKFKIGIGRLYEGDIVAYNFQLAECIKGLQNDPQINTIAHIRYCCGNSNRLLVIVLDNCDKRLRDEQLLMFEVAQWLQAEFRALVILPLREETYDNHRSQPPLDTALKDLVFRIEPPLFQHVLVRRVQLSLNELMQHGKKTFTYDLPNGFRVEYPASDQGYYLSSILKSIFEHDRYVRRMIVGLAGRNMRRAMEIFLEFCNSGYIEEDQIFKIRKSEGQHVLPLHLVARVLLRLNRRFYDSDNSYIKNLFSANMEDDFPSYFCRLMILRWLESRFNLPGTGGLKGYYSKLALKNDLVPHGISENVLDREINYLLRAQCIIAEHLRPDTVTDDELIRLSPAGFVHLESIGNVEYLAAVAEDTWFDDIQVAERIASRISKDDSHFSLQNTLKSAKDLYSYLEQLRLKLFPNASVFLEGSEYSKLSDLSIANKAIVSMEAIQSRSSWTDASIRYPVNSQHEGVIVNVKQNGIFVELEPGVGSFVLASRLSVDFLSNEKFAIGEKWILRIEKVAEIEKKVWSRLLQYVPRSDDDLSADWTGPAS